MKDFRNLNVWQKSHEFVLALYRHTAAFPKDERFGIVSQIRRAGLSIAATIAEGCGRGTDLDFARFLQVAMGSASEVQYMLLLSRDLSYLNDLDYGTLDAQVIETKRMLSSLIRKIRNGN